jgi:hypothetical protein
MVLFIAAILLAGILTVFIQLTTTLSILKAINTAKYKDLYITRCTIISIRMNAFLLHFFDLNMLS